MSRAALLIGLAQLVVIAIGLIATGVAFNVVQERSYAIDPPTQTDRMWTRGWPHICERGGGIAGIHQYDRAAYGANLWYFYRPALLTSLGIALGPWAVRYAIVTIRTRGRLRRGLCPCCGYDLAGAPCAICPECGALSNR